MVVGDGVGKGLDAAATMGQLRSAVRSCALTVRGPGDLLDALDRYARHHHDGRLATLIYADLDLRTRKLRYAVAGDPPPILLTNDREPVLLWDGRSTPLDSGDPQPSARDEAHRTLDRDGGLILYTDGLIARRTQTVDHGIHQDLRPDRRPDDACVLALRLAPQG